MLKMHIFYLKFEILRFRSEKLYDDYLYQNVCCILSHDKVKLKFERKPLALTQFFWNSFFGADMNILFNKYLKRHFKVLFSFNLLPAFNPIYHGKYQLLYFFISIISLLSFYFLSFFYPLSFLSMFIFFLSVFFFFFAFSFIFLLIAHWMRLSNCAM